MSLLDLTVNPVNDPTVVNQRLPDVSFIESFDQEWSVDLNTVFSDVDNALNFGAMLEDTTVIRMSLNENVLELFSIYALRYYGYDFNGLGSRRSTGDYGIRHV